MRRNCALRKSGRGKWVVNNKSYFGNPLLVHLCSPRVHALLSTDSCELCDSVVPPIQYCRTIIVCTSLRRVEIDVDQTGTDLPTSNHADHQARTIDLLCSAWTYLQYEVTPLLD